MQNSRIELWPVQLGMGTTLEPEATPLEAWPPRREGLLPHHNHVKAWLCPLRTWRIRSDAVLSANSWLQSKEGEREVSFCKSSSFPKVINLICFSSFTDGQGVEPVEGEGRNEGKISPRGCRGGWGINSLFTATAHTTSSLIPKLSFFIFFFFNLKYSWFTGFPGSSAGKEPACNAGDLGLISGLGRSPGWEDPLEKGVAIHSSILAQRIPMDRGAWRATVHGDQRVRHDWVTSTAHSWFTIFQAYSEVIKVYIYNNLYIYSFQIIFHYRLL